MNDGSYHTLIPSGYCASHAAELYLKILIYAHNPTPQTYKVLKYEKKHNLIELLDYLKDYDKDASHLQSAVKRLNKFSGTKVRYIEDNQHDVEYYGNDDISNIRLIKNYVENRIFEY